LIADCDDKRSLASASEAGGETAFAFSSNSNFHCIEDQSLMICPETRFPVKSRQSKMQL